MARNIELRTMEDIETAVKGMYYPYFYVSDSDSYSLENIQKPILSETPEEVADVGTFPANIREHFWVREGENDGDSWLAVGQLTNDAYFFFTGGCDYTGFDCQGGMCLWVSKSLKNIIEHGMTNEEYDLYMSQTIPYSKGGCAYCGDSPGELMPNDMNDDGDLCADCFWEEDAKRKRERRASPEWQYQAAYSAGIAIFGKSHEEAHKIASAACKKE